MMAAGAAVVQGWGTLLAAAQGVSSDKLGAGSGWMDGNEKSPNTMQRRAVCERPGCEESVFGKMLANDIALLDPATRETHQYRLPYRLPYQIFKELIRRAIAPEVKEAVVC